MEIIIFHNGHRSCSAAVVHSNIPHSAANKGNFEQIRVIGSSPKLAATRHTDPTLPACCGLTNTTRTPSRAHCITWPADCGATEAKNLLRCIDVAALHHPIAVKKGNTTHPLENLKPYVCTIKVRIPTNNHKHGSCEVSSTCLGFNPLSSLRVLCICKLALGNIHEAHLLTQSGRTYPYGWTFYI